MRIRSALTGLALGAAITVAGLATPAQAAPTESPTTTVPAAATVYGTVDRAQGDVSTMATWRFWRSYWTMAECERGAIAVINQGYDAAYCEGGYGTDGRWKYHLYVWA
ncbi:hypothetical protein [Streptomyces sp. NPDC056244]|uniref:hypothetical protein n=1 Tax=Streptomyces sp. NPDC056244 TaxID=3345762 RepID=UPI0035E0DE62